MLEALKGVSELTEQQVARAARDRILRLSNISEFQNTIDPSGGLGIGTHIETRSLYRIPQHPELVMCVRIQEPRGTGSLAYCVNTVDVLDRKEVGERIDALSDGESRTSFQFRKIPENDPSAEYWYRWYGTYPYETRYFEEDDDQQFSNVMSISLEDGVIITKPVEEQVRAETIDHMQQSSDELLDRSISRRTPEEIQEIRTKLFKLVARLDSIDPERDLIAPFGPL